MYFRSSLVWEMCNIFPTDVFIDVSLMSYVDLQSLDITCDGGRLLEIAALLPRHHWKFSL